MHLVPVYDYFYDASEFELAKFPESFMLNAAYTSGNVILCEDKRKLNIKHTKKN